MTDEQRSQTGWIDVQEWVVIFARAERQQVGQSEKLAEVEVLEKIFALDEKPRRRHDERQHAVDNERFFRSPLIRVQS